MYLWGFPKEWKWGYYLKKRDRHHNSSQAKLSSGGGRFGHENMRNYGGSQQSGDGFGGTTRINNDFGFGGGTISGGGFGNTKQYRDGENGTLNQGGYNGDLSHVHHAMFKMMEPHYRKFSGTIHLKHLMEAGGLSQNNGTLPYTKHHWLNKKACFVGTIC